jgi:hypothetical protein
LNSLSATRHLRHGIDPKHTSRHFFRCNHSEKAIGITIGSSTRHAAMGFALILNVSRNIRLRDLLARRVLGEGEATSIAPEARPLI